MAKTSIWQRIKNFFTGGGSKKTTTTKTTTRTVSRPSAHSSRTASTGSQYAYNGGGNRKQTKKEKKLEPKRTVYKVDSDTNRYKRINEVLSQQKQKQQQKQIYAKMTGDNKRTKAQTKLAQKMQLPDRVQADAKFTAKYQPKRYAVTKGMLKGATLGASETARKYGSKGVKQADAYYEKNKTKTEKRLETAGEIGGSLLSFGTTKGLSEKALSKTVQGADRLTKGLASKGGKAVEKKLVQKLGEKGGKKVAKGLAEDFAMNTFTGNVYNAIEALNEDGDAKDKLKTFGKNSAMGYAVGGALVGASAIKPALKNKGTQKAIEKLAKTVGNKGTQEEAEKVIKASGEELAESVTKKAESKEVTELKAQLESEKEHKKLLQQMPNGRRKQKALQDTNRRINDIRGKIKVADNPTLASSEGINNGAEIIAKDVPETAQDVSRNVSQNASEVAQDVSQNVSQEAKMPEPRTSKYNVTRAQKKLATDGNAIDKDLAANSNNVIANSSSELPSEVSKVSKVSKVTRPEEKLKVDSNVIDSEQAVNRNKLKPLTNAERTINDIESDLKANDFTGGSEFGMDEEKMTGLEGNSKEYETTEEIKQHIRNNVREQPKSIDGYNNVHEFIDDYAQGRIALNDDDVRNATISDTKTGGVADDVNNSLKKLQEALKSGDEEATVTAREKFERSIRDAEGCEIFTKEHLYNTNEPINVKIANIDELPEDVIRSTDYIKTKDFDKFEGDIAKENVKLGSQGKRISNTYATAESMTASDMARTLMENMKGNHIYNVEGNLENLTKSCERVFKNGNPSDVLNEIGRLTRTGELPKRKDMLNTFYDAQVLREYCNMYMSKVPEEMAQGFRDGYAIAQDYIANVGTLCGQATQSQACFRAMSPSVKAIKTERQIREFFKGIGLDDWDRIKSQVPMFDELFETIRTGSGTESSNAVKRALELSREISPRTFADFINQWRYLSMLGNAKTHARNVIGNAVMFGKSIVDDSIAGVLQDATKNSSITRNVKEAKVKPPINGAEAVEKLSAKSSTKSKTVLADTYNVLFNKKSEVSQKAQKALDEDIDSLMHGSIKYVDTSNVSDIKLNKNYELVSTNKLARGVDHMSKFNSWALEKEDEVFIKLNYKKAYAEYCASNGFQNASGTVREEIENRAREHAKKEALEMTYRDYNSVAQMLNNFTTKATRNNAPFPYKAGNFMMKAVMPFTTTPMNVTKQSLKSSPVGLVVSTKRLYNAMKIGDMDAINKNLSDLSKGITGTGIMALGMWMGTKDRDDDLYLTTDAGDDAINKYYKQLGYQNYSVKLGDKTYTIDWLTPLSTTLFVGAETGKNMRNVAEGMGDSGTRYDDVANLTRVCSRFISPIMQLTMLQGVQTVLDQANADATVDSITNVLSAISSNYISSLTPTAIKQIGRTIQPYDYMTVNRSQQGIASQMEYSMKNNLAWVDAVRDVMAQAGIGEGSSRGADTDINGNIKGLKTSGKDYAKSLLDNTLKPWYSQDIIKDSNDEELIRVAEALQKEDGNDDRAKYALNRKSYSTELKVGTGDYQNVTKLSDKDISAYNQAKQNAGYDAVAGVLRSKPFNKTDVRLTDEEKEEILANAPKTLKDAQKWLFKQDVYKNATASEKYSMLQAMSGGAKKNKTTGWVRTAGKMIYEKNGKSEGEYVYDSDLTEGNKKKIQKYVDSGLLDKDLVATYYELAGHEHYSDSKDDDYNGTRYYYFSKVDLLGAFDTLESDGVKLSEEQKAALYNTFKYGNSKPYYTGMTAGGSGSGYRRRSYRHYGHSSGGRRRSGSTANPIKASDYKVTDTSRDKVDSSVFGNPALNSKSSKKSTSKVTDAYINKILKQVKE